MRFAMLLLLLLVWRLGADDRVAERAGSAGEVGKATKEAPFRNSLGMEFVPVKGAAGTLWSRWETRVQDYGVCCKESGREHEAPDFPQGEDHPVVNVSFEDAVAFCGWLSKKEGRRYRLPTDHEWSVAVGIGDREDAKATPQSKDEKIAGVYPWGGVWPPPLKCGNYDEAMKVDSFEGTSPVGKFAPTADGLYDLGGNVWEWCDTDFVPGEHWKVLRGASWLLGGKADFLSSARSPFAPAERYVSYGFRVVLEAGGGVGDLGRDGGGGASRSLRVMLVLRGPDQLPMTR
jgi:formylglycine-generating enzyme required for sulfatase activity